MSIILLITSIAFIIIVLLALIFRVIVTITANQHTNGIIVDIKSQISFDTTPFSKDIIYRPEFRYSVDGVDYTRISTIGSTSIKYEIGDIVDISYRKKNPQDSYITADKKSRNSIFPIFFLMPMIIGCILIILSYFKN